MILKYLVFILLLDTVFTDECVLYNFEDDFDELFDNTKNPCSSLPSWSLSAYSDTVVERPNENSEHFMSPIQAGSSCITSFDFWMEPGGVVEINTFMVQAAAQDVFNIILYIYNAETGSPSNVGSATYVPTGNMEWETIRINVLGSTSNFGYISFISLLSGSGSVLLVDSFRYIPNGVSSTDISCQLYAEETEGLTTTTLATETTENESSTENYSTTEELITTTLAIETTENESTTDNYSTTEELITTTLAIETTENESTTDNYSTTENLITTTLAIETTENESTTENYSTTEDLITTTLATETTENESTTENYSTTEDLITTTLAIETTENESTTENYSTTEDLITTTLSSESTTTENESTTENYSTSEVETTTDSDSNLEAETTTTVETTTDELTTLDTETTTDSTLHTDSTTDYSTTTEALLETTNEDITPIDVITTTSLETDLTTTDTLTTDPTTYLTTLQTTTDDYITAQTDTTTDMTTANMMTDGTTNGETSDEIILPVLEGRGFWTPLTITMVVLLCFIGLVIVALISYYLGRRDSIQIYEDLDIDSLPKIITVPRVKKVYPDINANPYIINS